MNINCSASRERSASSDSSVSLARITSVVAGGALVEPAGETAMVLRERYRSAITSRSGQEGRTGQMLTESAVWTRPPRKARPLR